MTQTQDKVIGVILKGYPRLSETFIVNEIRLLEALGYKLHIFALRNPGEAKVHESVRQVRAQVTYIPDYVWRFFFSFLIANMRLWWRRPSLYWQAFRLAVLRSTSRRNFSTIKRFVQAVYLVERGLPGTGVAHLHAHFSHDPTTVAYFAGWLAALSYSFSAHAKDIYLEDHDFLREKIWRAKFVVTCTGFNRDYLLRTAGNDAAIFRSYHGLDLQLFQPVPATPQPKRRPIILSIGRLVAKKGFPVLLQSLQQLKQQLSFKCYIIGSGPMQHTLEALCDRLDLRHCVEILPPMSQSEVLSYYRQADLFALACEVQEDGDRDGIPNVLVEAMVMGIPVVSTAISGIPELVKHGINGWLVPEKDPAALAQAILTLLDDPALARRLAAAGRAKVEREFDATQNVKKIGKLLRAALASTAPSSTTASHVWEIPDRDGRFKTERPAEGGIAVVGSELTKIDKFLEPRIGDIMASASSKSLVADKLYTLDIALDNRQMRDVFASLARMHLGENIEVRHLGIEVMRRRNQRCVIRYRVQAVDIRKQRSIEWRVIGKVYKANRGERVFRSMLQLWEDGFSRNAPDGISIPEPLDFSSFLCMLFQEEVPGLTIKTLIKQSPDTFIVRRLARTLVKLHQSPLTPDNMMTVTDHLERCHPTHRFLSLALPELSTKIDYIVDNALNIEAALGQIHFTPIHGDFHMGQVHHERGHTWLIDFDAMGYGDPAADLGNLLVFLKDRARKTPNVSELIQAFLEEYFSVMDLDIAQRIPLHEALTHLRRACKSLRLQEQGWERRATRMVDQGVACIDRCAAHRGLNYDDELNFHEATDEAEAFV